MNTSSTSQDFLLRLEPNLSVVQEVLTYCQLRFTPIDDRVFQMKPHVHHPQIPTWQAYIEEAHSEGVFTTLQRYLTAFQFPIEEGISQSAAYRAATKQGRAPQHQSQRLTLQSPHTLSLYLYKSVAGTIPVLVVPHPADFADIIRALAYKNEPRPIPASMGASLLSGLNNWHRIHKLKAEWEQQNPRQSWNHHFRSQILPNKDLYQDRLIILSEKSYSGVSPEAVGLDETTWLQYSNSIRLAHEVTHYFTKQYMGGMHVHLHDETVADYMGIKEATGRFQTEWFLCFMGLEASTYRSGGRMENYIIQANLSDPAQQLLQEMLRLAAQELALFDQALPSPHSSLSKVMELATLCMFSLDKMAQPNAHQHMLTYFTDLQAKYVSFLA